MQGQFVEGKQGAAGDVEIATACLATEAERTGGATVFIDGGAFAARADRLAVRCGLVDGYECRLCFLVRHAHTLRDSKCAGTG